MKLFRVEKQPVHFSNYQTRWYKVFVGTKERGSISYDPDMGYTWSEIGGFFSKLEQCKKYVREQLFSSIYAIADEKTQAIMFKEKYGCEKCQ